MQCAAHPSRSSMNALDGFRSGPECVPNRSLKRIRWRASARAGSPFNLLRLAPAVKNTLRLLLVAGVCSCAPLHDRPPAPQSAELASANPSSASTPQNSNSDDLALLSTVTSIEGADIGNPRKKWVVTTRVDKVLAGHFAGSQFSFAIHSPAQSGLEVGKQYRIRATRTHEGYLVNQDQWRQRREASVPQP